jgi:hypothetical protein
MLTFSTQALEELKKRFGCRPAFRIELIMTSTFNLTQRANIRTISAIRSAFRPLERRWEIGTFSARFDNHDRSLSAQVALTPQGTPTIMFGQTAQGSKLTCQLGVELTSGAGEVQTVFIGHVDYVLLDPQSRTAEIKAVDVTEKIRSQATGRTGVDSLHPIDPTLRFDDCPARLVQRMLGSGFLGLESTLIDSSSFDSAVFDERSSRVIARAYKIPDGSWESAFTALLSLSQSALISSSGVIRYYTPKPQRLSGTYTLTVGINASRIRSSGPLSHIRTRARVERSATDLQSIVETTHSPVIDSVSETKPWGRRDDVTQTHALANEDFPAENAAGRHIFWRSGPIDVYEVSADWQSIRLQSGDVVLVTEPEIGLQSRPCLVLEVSINPPTAVVEITAIDSALTNQPWLYVDNSQTLDSGQKIY